MELGEELVSRFPSFGESLGAEGIETLLAALEKRQLKDGEVLLTDGETPGIAYLLLEGSIRIIVNPGDARLDAGVLEPGTWIGEVSLLDGGPTTATAIATAPSRVLGLKRSVLDELRTSHPRVAASLLRAMTLTLAKRVRQASNQLETVRATVAAHEGMPREQLHEALRHLTGTRGPT